MNYPLKFVQILRGFAAIAVVLYHAGIYSGMYFQYPLDVEFGSLGVDFFFALSGFIITYIHLKDIKEKGSVKSFLLKRFLRIFPFYWLVLIAVVALDPFLFSGWRLFIENMFLFRLPMSAMPLKVAWSMTFEIYFYAVFALAIASGWKAAKIILVVWCLLIMFSPPVDSPFFEVLTSNLNIEFLFGCLAAYLFIEQKMVLKLKVFLSGLFIVTLLFIACIETIGFNRFNIIMTILMGAASSWIILHAALLDRAQQYRALALPVLVLAGDASYAIYLGHTVYMPYLYKAVNYLVDLNELDNIKILLLDGLIIFLSIFFGILIHLLIEKPLLLFLRRRIKSI